jgi:hypothetical protein
MKSTEKTPMLSRAVEIVLFLFAAFGGFLTKLAPPDSLVGGSNPVRLVGIASFVALLVLLLSVSLVRVSRKRYYRYWITVSVICFVGFIVLAIYYDSEFDDHTFKYYDGTQIVAGQTLTSNAVANKQEYERAHAGITLTKAELLAKYGGKERVTSVWEEDSIRRVEQRLRFLYIATVICLAIAVFSLTEGVLLGR